MLASIIIMFLVLGCIIIIRYSLIEQSMCIEIIMLIEHFSGLSGSMCALCGSEQIIFPALTSLPHGGAIHNTIQ